MYTASAAAAARGGDWTEERKGRQWNHTEQAVVSLGALVTGLSRRHRHLLSALLGDVVRVEVQDGLDHLAVGESCHSAAPSVYLQQVFQ